jgi:hypothetical protein
LGFVVESLKTGCAEVLRTPRRKINRQQTAAVATESFFSFRGRVQVVAGPPKEPAQMGAIEFKGESPFQITLQGDATVIASGGNVVVTLPVSSGGSHPQAVEIQVMMTIAQAEQLHHQIPAPVTVARRNFWLGQKS